MKQISSKMAALCLGEEKVMSGAATLVMTDCTNDLPEEYAGKGIKKYMIGGAVITDANFPINKSWNMAECDIVIIPRKIFTHYKEGDGAELSHLLTGHYSLRDMWKNEVPF